MPFPQQKLRSCSILEELSTKEGTVGARCFKLLLTCLPLETGDGLTLTTGSLCGLPYLRPALHPENYFAVAARKDAQDDVNVKRQH